MRPLARNLRDPLRTSYQRMLLRSSLSRLDACIASGRLPATPLVEDLVRGWGNAAWSADVTLLTTMLEWLPKTSGVILECGSGLSTLVLGVAARASGRRVLSFEHNPAWAARLERNIPKDLRGSIEVCVTPIRRHGDFDWYSLEGMRLPNDIGFVVCDGPPGTTRGGRYGLGPLLTPLLSPGCIVLLDDAQRSAERDVTIRWCTEL